MIWEKIIPKGISFESKIGSTAQLHEGKVYIFGGRTSDRGNTNETYSYDVGIINKKYFCFV